MNPEVIDALSALGNLALIVICIIMGVGAVQIVSLQQKVISIAERLNAHISLDEERFMRVNKDLGKHDSDINDAKMANIERIVQSAAILFRAHSGNGNNGSNHA